MHVPYRSSEVKELMISRLDFFSGFTGAVTEATNFNSADVIAVKHSGRIQEYEIKVSRADLIGEMRCARVAAGLEHLDDHMRKDGNGHRLSHTKYKKHLAYLNEHHRQGWKVSVPDNFYWCIPVDLFTLCFEMNKGLPYGIYVFNPTDRMANILQVPRNLKPPIMPHVYRDLFNRACTQWADTRVKLREVSRES